MVNPYLLHLILTAQVSCQRALKTNIQAELDSIQVSMNPLPASSVLLFVMLHLNA